MQLPGWLPCHQSLPPPVHRTHAGSSGGLPEPRSDLSLSCSKPSAGPHCLQSKKLSVLFLPLPAPHSLHTCHRATHQGLSRPSRATTPRVCPGLGEACPLLSLPYLISSSRTWPSRLLSPEACLSQLLHTQTEPPPGSPEPLHI